MINLSAKALCALMMAFSLAACSDLAQMVEDPTIPEVTATRNLLLDLPPPQSRVDIAVYEFEDLSGQYKPSDVLKSLSRAVSQGGGSVLIKALRETSEGK